MRFNGADYRPSRDDARLSNQHEKVRSFMSDGQWHTLKKISDAIKEPPASVSAQLRHLRKPRFGGHDVQRRYLGDGVYEYRVVFSNVD